MFTVRVVVSILLALTVLPGCGAKTGLRSLPASDASSEFDARARPDARTSDARVPSRDGALTDGGRAPPTELCIEVPFRQPPRELRVEFRVQIDLADVLFLIDSTESMDGEIEVIRRRLRDTIAPGLTAAIPDVQLAVATFADFPFRPFGEPGDLPFVLRAPSTGTLADVQRALDGITVRGGGVADLPEAQIQALYCTATGAGWGSAVPGGSCPAGTVGYPCFRADGARVIVLITDAAFHDSPRDASLAYGNQVSPRPRSYADTLRELRRIGGRVLGLWSGAPNDVARRDLVGIARDSGALQPGGEPLVLDIGQNGAGLETEVVNVVRRLVADVPIDVDLLLEDEPGDAADAARLVSGVRTDGATPPTGAMEQADGFIDVRPGTRVRFVLTLANDAVPPAEDAQVFPVRVVLRGDDVTRLDEQRVYVVVPGTRGGSCADLGF